MLLFVDNIVNAKTGGTGNSGKPLKFCFLFWTVRVEYGLALVKINCLQSLFTALNFIYY